MRSRPSNTLFPAKTIDAVAANGAHGPYAIVDPALWRSGRKSTRRPRNPAGQRHRRDAGARSPVSLVGRLAPHPRHERRFQGGACYCAGRCGLWTGGDFVECGTFKGDMAWVVLQTIGAERIPRFWLFNSFDGFSPNYSSVDDFPDSPGFLDFANGFYRQTGLYEYVRDRFAQFPNVTLVRGFLPEALDAAIPAGIGFLHVDLNSPRAEIAVLERLFERVLPGGVVVFDDYGWGMFHKQKEAEDDFMRRQGYEILEMPTGQGLVVKR